MALGLIINLVSLIYTPIRDIIRHLWPACYDIDLKYETGFVNLKRVDIDDITFFFIPKRGSKYKKLTEIRTKIVLNKKTVASRTNRTTVILDGTKTEEVKGPYLYIVNPPKTPFKADLISKFIFEDSSPIEYQKKISIPK